MKLALGIESTAHTFGVGIMSFDGKVLANEISLFTTENIEINLVKKILILLSLLSFQKLRRDFAQIFST